MGEAAGLFVSRTSSGTDIALLGSGACRRRLTAEMCVVTMRNRGRSQEISEFVDAGMPRLIETELTRLNKIARATWQLVWLLLFRPTPVPLHAWRRFLLRCFGAQLGREVRVYPSARIWAPWNLRMGVGSCIGPNVDCYSVAIVYIGPHATISQYSYLCSASHDYRFESMPLIVGPITIGARAWVTADVFVGPGVSIGEGAVITARSSVFDDVAPWTVAKGNPAVSVKRREFRSAAK